MKISYVIATEKPPICAETVIKSILDLPSHNKEIIAVSSNEEISKIKGIDKFVFDDKNTGGVYAYNIGYKQVKGDWIVNVIDDNTLPENFLDFLKDVETDEFKKLTIHAGQLAKFFWGPGKQLWDKDLQSYADGHWYNIRETIPIEHPNQTPYQSLNVPIILAEDVHKYLDGVCWNESFYHHWPDHWLGLYTEYINGCQTFFPKSVYIREIPSFNTMRFKIGMDYYDIKVFQTLRDLLYSDKINYNYRVII